MIRFKVWQAGIATCVALALQGCGGGGGGSTAAPTSHAAKPSSVAKVATSFEPSGGTAAPANLFPVHPGDVWVNDILDTSSVGAGLPSGVLETNTITTLLNGTLSVHTTQSDGKNTDTVDYVVQAKGIASSPDFFGVLSDKANPRVDSFVVYPTQTLPPVGQARTYVRQGDLGEDLDEDGTNEGFRFEFSQIHVGTESRTLAYSSTPKQLVHLKSTVRISVMVSSQNNAAQTRTVVTDEYLEPGVGVVRSEAQITEADGSTSQEVTELKSAVVGGAQIGPALVAARVINVPVSVYTLVYVPSRQWFLGVVNDVSGGHYNQVVAIDANTGRVLGYSATLSQPTSLLKASPNANVAYVGVGYGEVIQLSLEGDGSTLPETGRLVLPLPDSLPTGSFDNLRYAAIGLAISPADPQLVVVASSSPGLPFNQRKTFIIQNMAVASTALNAADQWFFNADGTKLMGFNTSVTAGPLAIQVDALQNNQLTFVRSISADWLGNLLGLVTADLYNNSIYTTGRSFNFDDLYGGTYDDANCRVLVAKAKKVCPGNDGFLVKSMDFQNQLAALTFDGVPTSNYSSRPIVAGPSGVIAVFGAIDQNILIFKHPQLQ